MFYVQFDEYVGLYGMDEFRGMPTRRSKAPKLEKWKNNGERERETAKKNILRRYKKKDKLKYRKRQQIAAASNYRCEGRIL
ncbi:hypothetical protein CVS40_1274 [Lucilia cuprina]|nr:hypothetical protein CVS40_1274 [Lucilia cuprina]